MPIFDPYPHIRESLAAEFSHLSPWQIEALFENYNLSAENIEEFFSTMNDIGKAVVKVAPTVLPVAAVAGGTALFGPVGGAVAGGLVSQTMDSRTPVKPSAVPAMQVTAPSATGIQAVPQASSSAQPSPVTSPAAYDFFRSIFHPKTLQAFQNLFLNQIGGGNVKVNGTNIDADGFINLIKLQLDKLQAERQAARPGQQKGLPEYLYDEAGELIGDPYEPESRAERLESMLFAAYLPQVNSSWALKSYPIPYDEWEEDVYLEWPVYDEWEEDAEEDFYGDVELAEYYDNEEVW